MMDITLYQIDPEKDSLGVLFEDLRHTQQRLGSGEVDASVYGKAFEGEVEAEDLEGVFECFNMDKPEGFGGRSMSVSDVVAVRDRDTGKTDCYFCDAVGFRKIDFDEKKAAEPFRAKIRVVYCEPGRPARVTQIGTALEDLQKAVGGLIEAYYPFEEEVCIVCNDEGKLNGMSANRAIYDEEHNIQDIIFGPFFVCDCSTPEFGSLSEEQTERYRRMFESPEHFIRLDGKIHALPYTPAAERQQAR